jgi:phosphotriesterase-related protein
MERWAMNWRQDGHPVQRSHDTDRIGIVVSLLEAGFVDQVLISQDVCMQSQLVRNGGWGYAHITRNIEPRLKAAGVSDGDIATMRVENPRRLLAREDA